MHKYAREKTAQSEKIRAFVVSYNDRNLNSRCLMKPALFLCTQFAPNQSDSRQTCLTYSGRLAVRQYNENGLFSNTEPLMKWWPKSLAQDFCRRAIFPLAGLKRRGGIKPKTTIAGEIGSGNLGDNVFAMQPKLALFLPGRTGCVRYRKPKLFSSLKPPLQQTFIQQMRSFIYHTHSTSKNRDSCVILPFYVPM